MLKTKVSSEKALDTYLNTGKEGKDTEHIFFLIHKLLCLAFKYSSFECLYLSFFPSSLPLLFLLFPFPPSILSTY